MIIPERYEGVQGHQDIDEREIFSVFFRKYYPLLLFYATRFLDGGRAEDVVQDAFAELWQRRAQLELGEKLSGFMYRSVYTKSLNVLKHDRIVNNHQSVEYSLRMKKAEFMSPDNNEVLKFIENNELAVEIDSVIESLPEKTREVFKLSYLHNLKNKDIADILQISVKTVEAHMYKALKFLRKKLGHLLILLTTSLMALFGI